MMVFKRVEKRKKNETFIITATETEHAYNMVYVGVCWCMWYGRYKTICETIVYKCKY